ncbi:hypothetical protein [Kribbella sp. NPDC051718]|uniref:hypothetical protein n=1 Tax=Kribbella sp. NPDC051718 TaxID=3155168 RepID=UPI003447BD5E
MFDTEIAKMDATEALTSLASMHDLRTRADLEILRLAQHFADLFPDPATVPDHVSLPGGERGHVYGGAGCPAVAEFAVAEFGAAIGRSAGSAANLIGQALALRYRLPFLWAQVESLNAEPWKACTVATACLTLSVEAAAIVDRRVAPIINTVTPRQTCEHREGSRLSGRPRRCSRRGRPEGQGARCVGRPPRRARHYQPPHPCCDRRRDPSQGNPAPDRGRPGRVG